MKFFTLTKDIVLNILFPPLCLGCKKNLENRNELLCVACKNAIRIDNAYFCGECGARLPSMKKTCHLGEPLICGAPEIYGQEPATEVVKLLKYSGIVKAADILGEMLFRYATSLAIPLGDFELVPIPLPKSRLRKRGYNQAELITKSFLKYASLHETKLISSALARKFTKPQTEMKNLLARKENIKNCFVIIKPELVMGKNILLVDDVYTSGATMHEAAWVLKSAGAKKILGLTILRAHVS